MGGVCELNCFYVIFIVVLLIIILCVYDFYTFLVIVTIVFFLLFTCYVFVENVKSKITDPKFIKDQLNKLKPLIQKEFSHIERKVKEEVNKLEFIIKDKTSKLSPEIRNELNNIKDKVKGEIEKFKLIIKDRDVSSIIPEINQIKETIKEEFERLKSKYDKLNPEIKEELNKIGGKIIKEIENFIL